MALAVFAIVLCVYVTTTGGSYATDVASYEVTKNLVQHGTVAMSYNVLDTEAERGVDGRYYAPVGLGHPLFGVPFYALSRAVRSAFGLALGKPETLDKAAVVTGSAVAAALCAPAAFLFAWRLSGSTNAALMVAFALAFGTTLWPYSKFGFNAPLATACLLWATYLTWRGVRSSSLWPVALGGTALACALLTRHEMAIMAVPLAVWISAESWNTRGELLRRLVVFSVPVAIGVVTWMSYNAARFGHPFDTGLLRDPNVRFDTPILVGLHGLLASPGRSLLLYAPLTVPGLAAMVVLFRRDRSTALLFSGQVTVLLLVIARMHQWDGGESYGPRYLVPVLPYLILPLVACLSRASPPCVARWLPVAFALSVLVQLPGVLVDYSKVQNAYARRTPGYSITMSRYSWAATPLVLNTKASWRAVPANARYLLGIDSPPVVEPIGDESRRDFSQQFAYSLDFWWLYLFHLGAVSAPIAVVMGVVPAALALAVGMALRRRLSR